MPREIGRMQAESGKRFAIPELFNQIARPPYPRSSPLLPTSSRCLARRDKTRSVERPGRLEDFIGMARNLNLSPGTSDAPFAIDQKG